MLFCISDDLDDHTQQILDKIESIKTSIATQLKPFDPDPVRIVASGSTTSSSYTAYYSLGLDNNFAKRVYKIERVASSGNCTLTVNGKSVSIVNNTPLELSDVESMSFSGWGSGSVSATYDLYTRAES